MSCSADDDDDDDDVSANEEILRNRNQLKSCETIAVPGCLYVATYEQ
jgi:hypothetical protein